MTWVPQTHTLGSLDQRYYNIGKDLIVKRIYGLLA